MIERNSIPNDAYVSLTIAHTLIGKSRSTVYQWYRDERFTTIDRGNGTEVRVGELRELERKMIEQRKRRKK